MPTIDQSAVTAIELCIAAAAHDPEEKLPSGWELTAWGKGDLHGNQAIIAAQTGSQTYAVAIRGTVIDNILNWIMDFEVFQQEPFPGMAGGANIAKGSMDGLNDLLAMKGEDGQALPTFVGTLLAQGDSVLVTGHSLGGNLASVLAPYLALQHLGTALTACTFARPPPATPPSPHNTTACSPALRATTTRLTPYPWPGMTKTKSALSSHRQALRSPLIRLILFERFRRRFSRRKSR